MPFLRDAPIPSSHRPATPPREPTGASSESLIIRLRNGDRSALDPLFRRHAAHLVALAAMLQRMTRWYTPAEVLRMATSENAELLQLSGPRSPYPGRLGVVAEEALADLLLVDGDPIADIGILADPERRLLVIMKDGIVYKNTLR